MRHQFTQNKAGLNSKLCLKNTQEYFELRIVQITKKFAHWGLVLWGKKNMDTRQQM